MTKVDPYLHAVLLIYGSDKEVTKDAIISVIKAAGGKADEAKAQVLADALKDVNMEDALKNVSFAAPSAPAASAAPAGGEKKKTEKKDEKKSEEEAAAGLAGLFG